MCGHDAPSFLLSKANGFSGCERAGSAVALGGTRKFGLCFGSLRAAALEDALPMTSQAENDFQQALVV